MRGVVQLRLRRIRLIPVVSCRPCSCDRHQLSRRLSALGNLPHQLAVIIAEVHFARCLIHRHSCNPAKSGCGCGPTICRRCRAAARNRRHRPVHRYYSIRRCRCNLPYPAVVEVRDVQTLVGSNRHLIWRVQFPGSHRPIGEIPALFSVPAITLIAPAGVT